MTHTRGKTEAGPWPTRFGDLILDAIARHGLRLAIIDGDTQLTYAQLGDRIAHALGAYRGLGLRGGETIAQLSGNRADLFAAMAAAYIGGYKSLTLHAMGGIDDHRFILENADARILIADAAHAARAAMLSQALGDRMGVFLHDGSGPLPGFWDLPADSTALPPHAAGDAETIIRLAYTGGTTGVPKGVMLSNRALVTNTRLALDGIPWPDEVRFLCPAPISHGAGSIVVPTLIQGGTVILQHGFSAAGFLADLGRFGATVSWMVPTMIGALLDCPEIRTADTSSLATLIYSGAPMSPSRIRQALERFGPVLFQSYGQTEAPNTILGLSQAEHRIDDAMRLSATGRPFPGVEVAILDEAGLPVSPGDHGEICVRGPLLMSGYWRNDEATNAAIVDGWLHTGDMGFIDDDGFYHIVDRRKDMIISGGFNVYPKEVEDVIARHPAVADVAVFGTPDPKWGEAVHALVVLKAEASVTAEELADSVRLAKGPIQTPKSIAFVDAIPLTALGKADKKRIRAEHLLAQPSQ